jgi:RHS repeat-associated protein
LAQQTVLQDGVQASQTQFDYDDNGSLTNQSSDNGDSTAYRYDARGRLSGATVVRGGDTTETSYVYSADGIRAAETVNGASTRYIIDGFGPSGYAQVVEEWSDGANGSPILLASYVFGAGLVPVSTTHVTHDANGQVTGTQTGLFLADGHSGVRQVINVATDGVILVNRYDAFGSTVATAGSFATPIGYRGQWFDAVLGQYVMRARIYDPASGRFTAMDPAGGTYGDVMQLMRYGYGGVNPINNLDPTGLDEGDLSSLQIAIGIGIGLTGLGLFLGIYGRIDRSDFVRYPQATISYFYFAPSLNVNQGVKQEVNRIFQNAVQRFGAAGDTLTINWSPVASRDEYNGKENSAGRTGSSWTIGFHDGLRLEALGQTGSATFGLNPNVIREQAQQFGISVDRALGITIAHESGHHIIADETLHRTEEGFIDSQRSSSGPNAVFSDIVAKRIVNGLRLRVR